MGTYEGRLVSDGFGNLLADEGDNAGAPVIYDLASDEFHFIQPGDPSHNELHHKKIAGIVGTQADDPDAPGYAGTAENPTKGNEHHFGVLDDDPHKDGLKFDPDKVAAKRYGHTHSHKVGE